MIDGRLTATAETVSDTKALLALGARSTTPSIAKRENKKACPLCSKRVKYLQAHTKKMHTGYTGGHD